MRFVVSLLSLGSVAACSHRCDWTELDSEWGVCLLWLVLASESWFKGTNIKGTMYTFSEVSEHLQKGWDPVNDVHVWCWKVIQPYSVPSGFPVVICHCWLGKKGHVAHENHCNFSAKILFRSQWWKKNRGNPADPVSHGKCLLNGDRYKVSEVKVNGV